MPLRLFTCPICNHKMRFAGANCGHCHRRKDFYAQPGVWWAMMIVLGGGALWALLSAVL